MKGIVNILVLGKENVGKTAIVVRFLTKRFLTEYAHAPEMTYERVVVVGGKQVPVKITDVCGKSIEQRQGSRELLAKTDGVVVVYSISDRHSYDVADGICDWLRRDSHIPVVLLGNKSDLDHIRSVSRQTPTDDELPWRGDGYLVSECSASTDGDGITHVFTSLVQKILEKKEIQSKQQRKLSQNPIASPKLLRATIKRRLSVFTRDRTSTM